MHAQLHKSAKYLNLAKW